MDLSIVICEMKKIMAPEIKEALQKGLGHKSNLKK